MEKAKLLFCYNIKAAVQLMEDSRTTYIKTRDLVLVQQVDAVFELLLTMQNFIFPTNLSDVAKYCQGYQSLPSSDFSKIQFPGLGEFAAFTITYAI